MPLAVATCVDLYVRAHMILHSHAGSGVVAGSIAALFAGMWGVLPLVARLQLHARSARARDELESRGAVKGLGDAAES